MRVSAVRRGFSYIAGHKKLANSPQVPFWQQFAAEDFC
jgi:hypothetical protein